MKQLTANVFVETGLKGANHRHRDDNGRPRFDRYAAQAQRRRAVKRGDRASRPVALHH